MSTRIVMVDYVNYCSTSSGDICTNCRRHERKSGTCQHFGQLALKPGTKSTYQRHPNCIRAEERTSHGSISRVMMFGDFDPESNAAFDKPGDDDD